MENEEMLEQTNETENVETQTTEEKVDGIELTDTTETTEPVVEEKEEVKTFTQEQVNEIVKRRLARQERDYQKELSKYKDTEEVLKTTIGGNDINEINKNLRNAYETQGVKLPEPTKPGLTDREIEILAREEANEIIESGEAESEANKLARKGFENMNTRERAIFNQLASHLTREKKVSELKSIGVKSELLDSQDFKDFASKFNPNTSVKDIYDLYSKTHKEEKRFEKMGSMTTQMLDKVKSYYTPEEIERLTEEDLDDPKIWEAVRKSMTGRS